VYLTETLNCYLELIDFAKDYNFYLNVKVAWHSDYKNELNYLIKKSENCTVEAFTEDDYKDLARHLIPPVIPQVMTKRDEQTEEVLRNLQEGEDNESGGEEDDEFRLIHHNLYSVK